MEPEKKSNGALIGLIIIIILLLIGGIYVWQTNKNRIIENPPSPAVTEEDTNTLNNLEQDVNATDSNVDIDVNTVE